MMNKLLALLVTLAMCGQVATAQTGTRLAPSATTVGLLSQQVEGSSSLLYLDGVLWSANDHGRLRLFAIDTASGAVDSVVDLGVTVYDLEEIAQDSAFLYFGDFGDNNGIRGDLRVLRIAKDDFRRRRFRFDTIRFSYPDRVASRARDFDCEAFVSVGDSLYLFTKQWLSLRSACYSVPAVPGTHVARRCFELPTDGLVTGACFLPHSRTLVLVGYSLVVRPFVYVVTDFDAPRFDQGHHRRVSLANLPGTQTEAIASTGGPDLFLTCETLRISILVHRAALMRLPLRELLAAPALR